MAPCYPNVPETEKYLSGTTGTVTTDNWYWTSRLIAALADASFRRSQFHIERYTFSVQSRTRAVINETDRGAAALLAGKPAVRESKETGGNNSEKEASNVVQEYVSGKNPETERIQELLLAANHRTTEILREEAEKVLKQVLDETSNIMKNQYSRSDA